ncbi:MAG: DUF1822 family protein [Desmonostoc vinosum HA7617-LM4]|jgi:hypothetical protein|nr:DUF1822 family protein [Desmonostoc vinosum HA7617-LM4]
MVGIGESFGLGVILAGVVSGVLGNTADRQILGGYQAAYTAFLKHQGKFVNHDLEKALKRSFLLAQQSIADECRQEIVKSSRMRYRGAPRPETLEHEADIRLLNQKLKQLKQELNKVNKLKENTTPITSLSDLGLLLTQAGTLEQKHIKDQLLAVAIQDITVPCYQTKAENSLLERINAYFIFEIKNNPVVKDILQTQFLAKINLQSEDLEKSLQNVAQVFPQLLEKLENLEEKIQKIGAENQENQAIRQIIQIKLPLEELTPEQSQNIIALLREISEDVTLEFLATKKGSVILFFEGSQDGYERLQRLFQSGQLAQRLGVPVEYVTTVGEDNLVADIVDSNILDNFRQWFDSLREYWQKPQFLPARSAELQPTQNTIQRGKVIDLGEEQSIVLIIKVTEEPDEILGIIVSVYPTKDAYLPTGLQVITIDESGETIRESTSGKTSDSIKLEFAVAPQEQFSIVLKLGNIQVRENILESVSF